MRNKLLNWLHHRARNELSILWASKKCHIWQAEHPIFTINLELSRGTAGDCAIKLWGTWKLAKSLRVIWVDKARTRAEQLVTHPPVRDVLRKAIRALLAAILGTISVEISCNNRVATAKGATTLRYGIGWMIEIKVQVGVIVIRQPAVTSHDSNPLHWLVLAF